MKLFILSAVYCTLSFLSGFGHALTSYQPDAKIDVFVNKVGPYFNPHVSFIFVYIRLLHYKEEATTVIVVHFYFTATFPTE